MPTTEQILNKSATIYGPIGNSLQILNKRDKLKGADNAYVSVSNSLSTNALLSNNVIERLDVVVDRVRRYATYGLPVKEIYIKPSTTYIEGAAFTATGAAGTEGYVKKIVITESDTPIYILAGAFSDIYWDIFAIEDDKVTVDIGRAIDGTTINLFRYTGATKMRNAIVNIRKKPLVALVSSFLQGQTEVHTINVSWAEGEVAGAPWGATNATINYNVTEFPE